MGSWRGFFRGLWKVAKPVATVGLSLVIEKIVAKNPRSRTIGVAAEIIDAIIIDRPDLLGSKNLYGHARKHVMDSQGLTSRDKRDLLAELHRQLS